MARLQQHRARQSAGEIGGVARIVEKGQRAGRGAVERRDAADPLAEIGAARRLGAGPFDNRRERRLFRRREEERIGHIRLLSFPRKRESSTIHPTNAEAPWIPAFAGMTASPSGDSAPPAALRRWCRPRS